MPDKKKYKPVPRDNWLYFKGLVPSMKNKLGRKVVQFVNRHWLLFGVVAEPTWGFLLGIWTSTAFRNNDWGWFVAALVCTLVWMTMMFMKAYTDKENRV